MHFRSIFEKLFGLKVLLFSRITQDFFIDPDSEKQKKA